MVDKREQVIAQHKAVSHLARQLALVCDDYAKIIPSGAMDNLPVLCSNGHQPGLVQSSRNRHLSDAMRAMTARHYSGLAPTIILIGALVGDPTPFNIPPNVSQSGGHLPKEVCTPTELSAAPTAVAASTVLESEPSFVAMTTPNIGPTPVHVHGCASHLANCNAIRMILDRAPISSVSPAIQTFAAVPGKRDSAATICCSCSGLITRGASRSSILTRASRSPSAFWFASAARVLASATAASRPATLSRDCCRSLSQCASLTPAAQTISPVAITPQTKLTTNATLAQSDTRVAASNDGHIRLPLWFFLTALIIVVVSGVGAIVGRVWTICQRRGSRTTGSRDAP